jgi:hypothetical protein
LCPFIPVTVLDLNFVDKGSKKVFRDLLNGAVPQPADSKCLAASGLRGQNSLKRIPQRLDFLKPESKGAFRVADSLFCKIVAGEIHSNTVYQDDKCVAFCDVNPQAPTKIHHQ